MGVHLSLGSAKLFEQPCLALAAAAMALLLPHSGAAAEPPLRGDLCWSGPIDGASHSLVARSKYADFSGTCRLFTVDSSVTCITDSDDPGTVQVEPYGTPEAGEIFYFLVRRDTWGLDSSLQARTVAADHWKEVDRQVATTTLGNHVGIVCHNCYYDRYADERAQPPLGECEGGPNHGDPCQYDDDCPEGGSCNLPPCPSVPPASSTGWNDLDATLCYIREALDGEADAIELDLKYGRSMNCAISNAPNIEVRHGDYHGPCLADVLADPDLWSGDQLLFIETKGDHSAAQLTQLLCMFLPDDAPDPGGVCGVIPRFGEYARAGRPLVLRALRGRSSFLEDVYNELRREDGLFDLLRDHVRLNLSYLDGDTPVPGGTANDIDDWATIVDGFEFDYRDANLTAKTTYVRSLGMPVAVFGNKKYCLGDAYVASLREDVDFLIVDYPVGMARRVVEEDNRLLYLNVWDQFKPWKWETPPPEFELTYWDRDSTRPKSVGLGGSTFEYWSRLPQAEDLFGGVLVLDGGQHLTFDDGDNRMDNWSCAGYLVTAVVNFDGPLLPGYGLVSKAVFDSGFILELIEDDHPDPGPYLRFGAHVDSGHHTAEIYLPEYIDLSNSYLVVGAYDGHGKPRLWINDSLVTASGASQHGGVTWNEEPVLVGGPGSLGESFAGKIQRVSVLAWGNHPAPPDVPDRYHGQNVEGDCNPVLHIDVETAVNAADPHAPTRAEDADSPPGPLLALGSDVTFTYLVTNQSQDDSPIPMDNVSVADGGWAPAYVSGDTNGNGKLDKSEVWLYQYVSLGTGGAAQLSEATVDDSADSSIGDCDRSFHDSLDETFDPGSQGGPPR